MCFGSKLKGDDPSSRLNGDDQVYNSRPVEAKPQRSSSSKIPSEYAPPAGPPPGHNDEYAPPPGPPPSHDQYMYAPPPGPPPSQQPYHDWQTAVPDTSLLPPPPSLGNQRSSTNNATEQEAEQGEAWCAQNPFTPPVTLPEAALEALNKGEIGVIKPRGMKGDLARPRPGIWAGKTKPSSPDTSITSTIPLYSVMAHSPIRTGRPKTIYYEVRIAKRNRREVSLALGYAAPPYPSFRLPGWHRGCLAVHGDDGSKFINDRWGGKDFTLPFKAGETIGLGMTFTSRDVNAPPSYGPAQTTVMKPINIEVFLTRNGAMAGSWNLHEEGDAQEDLPVDGLEGMNDLYAAVGTFEDVEFEIVFAPGEWMFSPQN